jgi:hypothetical protein
MEHQIHLLSLPLQTHVVEQLQKPGQPLILVEEQLRLYQEQ